GLPKGKNGENRPDADDEAQHGEQRTQLVEPETLGAQPDDALKPEQGRPADHAVRVHLRTSLATWPSRSRMARCACRETLSSWVTRMIVLPCSCRSSKIFRISTPEVESRLPVGSTARMTSGSFTSARSIATRCSW